MKSFIFTTMYVACILGFLLVIQTIANTLGVTGAFIAICILLFVVVWARAYSDLEEAG